MPGMGEAPQTDDPTVVSAFHTALAHQGLVILVLLAVLAIAWNALRTIQYRRLVASGEIALRTASPSGSEPPARRLLRVSFGVLWLVVGLLQLQAAMPLGLPGSVLQPASAPSRGWVQAIVNVAITIWNRHPVEAAAAIVWIQVGIGVLLLVAPRGRWSRLAGVTALAWGLVVWIFGEAFGGIFAPGLTWLFGAPGAVLIYAVAGGLLAFPERSWRTADLGKRVLAGSGAFFILMAVLQAWPGRGFWQGRTPGGSGTLAQMLAQMASTSQPHVFSAAVSWFERVDLAHGWAVNLFTVIVLAATGVLLLSGRMAFERAGVVVAVAACLADWVLVEDLGVFGGTGTDPNSMIPMILLIVTGYVAVSKVPAMAVDEPAPEGEQSIVRSPWWTKLSGSDLAKGLAALGAIGVVLVGAVPMAFASINPHADAIVSEATDGTPNVVDVPAPGFDLVDQSGQTVSMSELKGREIALTFLDPVCTSDCPLIAQEFREADSLLGDNSQKVVFVAIVTNPLYRSVAAVDAFDRQEGLAKVPNWLFLTGTTNQLQSTWNDYGVQVQVEPAGAMVAHSDLAYVIDGTGQERVVLDADPPGGSVGTDSFVQVLASELHNYLPQ
jgi:cytochrome oxidase Cu insertion factor (SCO1/SenC/PrrC family)